MNSTNKHKAEVIETNEHGAAVRFSSGRIEWIAGCGLPVGTHGWVDYVRARNGFVWTFVPFKVQA